MGRIYRSLARANERGLAGKCHGSLSPKTVEDEVIVTGFRQPTHRHKVRGQVLGVTVKINESAFALFGFCREPPAVDFSSVGILEVNFFLLQLYLRRIKVFLIRRII